MEGTATASAAPTYGGTATLQYNTATPRTSGAEWITPFAASGGVIIGNTGEITMGGAKVFNANIPLTINTGATLTPGANLLTLGGNLMINGTGTLTSGTGGVTLAGAATTQSIGGFTTTGTVSMIKTAGSATFTGNVGGAGLAINGTGGTLNLGTTLTHTFTGDVSLSAGSLNGGTGTTLNVNSSTATAWNGTGSLFNPGTGTVIFGGVAQTIASSQSYFNNLTLSGGLKTFTNITSVSGNLSILSGAQASLPNSTNSSANSLNLGGTPSVPATGTFGSSGSAAANTNDTYFNVSSSGILFVGSCITGTWTGGISTDWNNGANWCSGVPDGTTDVIIPAGTTFQPHILADAIPKVAKSITINPGASLTFDGANTLTVSGNWTNSSTFTAGSGTVIFNGAAQSITGATTFNNVTLGGTLAKTVHYGQFYGQRYPFDGGNCNNFSSAYLRWIRYASV